MRTAIQQPPAGAAPVAKPRPAARIRHALRIGLAARAVGAGVAAGTVMLDQATKLASTDLPGPLGKLWLPVRNAEFSLGLASAPWAAQVVLMGAGLLIASATLGVAVIRGRIPGWAAGLVFGGALSNLLDRALLGSVRDFLPLGPVVVNAADLAVLIGLLTVLWAALAGRTPSHMVRR